MMLLLFSVLLLVFKDKKRKLLSGVAVDDVKRLEIYCKVMSLGFYCELQYTCRLLSVVLSKQPLDDTLRVPQQFEDIYQFVSRLNGLG